MLSACPPQLLPAEMLTGPECRLNTQPPCPCALQVSCQCQALRLAPPRAAASKVTGSRSALAFTQLMPCAAGSVQCLRGTAPTDNSPSGLTASLVAGLSRTDPFPESHIQVAFLWHMLCESSVGSMMAGQLYV